MNDHKPLTEQNKTSGQSSKKLGNGMILMAWLVLLGLLAAYFGDVIEREHNPNQVPEIIDQNGSKKLLLRANKSNHFVMTGQINNQDTTLLLDTGATNVAIPADMASRLELTPGREGIAMTANGPVKIFSTRIDKLQLGDIVLYDVPADLNPAMNGMNEVLLGMSALSQIEFTQRDGTLLLTR